MSEIQACDAVRVGIVIAHWLAAGMERWFAVDPAFDKALRDAFLADHERAAQGELEHWARRLCGLR